MSKSSVFAWRIAPETRDALERVAQRQGKPIAAVLDRVMTAWLRRQVRKERGPKEIVAIRERALGAIGAISGGDPTRSQRVRDRVRARLRGRHAG